MKAYIMGNYTEKAFQGFLKDPTSDRKAVVEQLTKAMGGTMHSMDIVRGSFDFVVVTDVPSFEDFAAIKLVVEASGAVKNLTILEAIDFTKATSKASAWLIMDTVRDSVSPMTEFFVAQASGAEFSAPALGYGFNSTGFSVDNTDGTFNENGATYIYLAIA